MITEQRKQIKKEYKKEYIKFINMMDSITFAQYRKVEGLKKKRVLHSTPSHSTIK